MQQSRRFPQQPDHPLSSFAEKVSNSDNKRLSANRCLSVRYPDSSHSRQATLHPAQQSTDMQVLSYVVTAWSRLEPSPEAITIIGLHGNGVRHPHAIADRPGTLTSSTNPELGVQSKHQKLHRYAL